MVRLGMRGERAIIAPGPDAIMAGFRAVLSSRTPGTVQWQVTDGRSADVGERTLTDSAGFDGLTGDELLGAYRWMVLVAEARRQGDPAQEPEPDLLPDQRRRPRGGARGRRLLPAPGLRLVLPLLPRPRALPRARRHAARDAAAGRGREGRPGVGRPPDAVALGPPPARTSCRRAARPGTQCLQAVGCAEAGRLYRPPRTTSPAARRASTPTRSSTCRSARARPPKGEFWESLNTACGKRLPVVYLVQDNGYAISVPVEVQTPGGDISKIVTRLPEPPRARRSTARNFLESHARHARGRRLRAGRRGPGARPRARHPALLALALRRREAVQDAEGARGGSRARPDRACFGRVPRGRGTRHRGRAAARSPRTSSARCSEAAGPGARGREAAPATRPPSWVFSPDVDPTSPAFDTPAAADGQARHDGGRHQPDAARRDGARTRASSCSARTWPTRRARKRCRAVSGQGRRLQGDARPAAAVRRRRACSTRRSPRRTSSAGRSGMATRGIKPVVEIQFFDYIWPAMMQLRDEMAMLRYRSGNHFSCPMVVRVPIGGYLRGGAPVPQPVAARASSPTARASGSRSRRNAVDAAGLLRTAIRCDDPVLFLEHKHLYRQTYNKGDVPGHRLHDPVRPRRAAARRRRRAWCSRGARSCSGRCWPRSRPRRTGSASRCSTCGRIIPYDWDGHRRTGEANQPRGDRARGPADVRLRRGDGRADRRRAVRAPRRAGPAASPRSTRRSPTARTSRRSSCRRAATC